MFWFFLLESKIKNDIDIGVIYYQVNSYEKVFHLFHSDDLLIGGH